MPATVISAGVGSEAASAVPADPICPGEIKEIVDVPRPRTRENIFPAHAPQFVQAGIARQLNLLIGVRGAKSECPPSDAIAR